jgi:acetyl esterase
MTNKFRSQMSNLHMDPAFAPLVKQPREVLRDANVVRQTIAAVRQQMNASSANLDLEIEDHSVSRSSGDNTQLTVRVYRNRKTMGALPALLYLHGGGFFCGDHLSDATQCAQYALHAHCLVISVAYRLAPEDPFPAALNDCYRALEFVWSESERLKVNRERIAIGGSSAGANLAAAVTLLARDRGGPALCFQMLLVPALDDRLETESALEFIDVPDFARPEAQVMWRWYLGVGTTEVSPYAAPAREKDLSGLPAAYVLCAGLDPLRDEGLEYARRLTAAGVAVELHLVPSVPHGFASIPSADISRRLLTEQSEVLCAAFGLRHDAKPSL